MVRERISMDDLCGVCFYGVGGSGVPLCLFCPGTSIAFASHVHMAFSVILNGSGDGESAGEAVASLQAYMVEDLEKVGSSIHADRPTKSWGRVFEPWLWRGRGDEVSADGISSWLDDFVTGLNGTVISHPGDLVRVPRVMPTAAPCKNLTDPRLHVFSPPLFATPSPFSSVSISAI